MSYKKWVGKKLVNIKRSLNRQSKIGEKVTFTDLNFDCLEHICSYLDTASLLNVADTSENLRYAARPVFAQRYKNTPIQLNGVHSSTKRKIIKGPSLRICDLKSSFQVLRCFGDLIPQLEITDEYSNKLNTHVYEYIFRYINKYCTVSLTSIKFQMIPKNCFLEIFKKPFPKMKSVEIFCCSFYGNLMPFNQLFPAIETLKTDFVVFDELTCIEQSFSHLKNLQLSTCKENIITTLRQNPQLRQFSTKQVCDVDVLQVISQQLGLLEGLQIVCDRDELANFNGAMIPFRNVKKLHFEFSHSKRTFPKIPLAFEQLEEISIWTNYQLNKEFSDFILKHTSITHLNIPLNSSSAESTTEHQFAFLKNVHALKELNLTRFILSTNEAIYLFSEFRNLNKFTFTVQCDGKYMELSDRVRWSNQWAVKKDRYSVRQLQVALSRRQSDQISM